MKTDRLISIILTLLEREKVSAKELSETFEVSLRTIYRDIDAINLAGVPILSTPGVNGGFQIMERYKVDKKVFSAADIVTLLKGLESVSGILSRDATINTFVKVKSLIPAEQASEIALKSNQILIDLQPWKGNPDIQRFLDILTTAVQEQRQTAFTYFDRKGQSSQRTIEPYKLVLKGNSWYVQGFCLERQDFRLFKLSRISELAMLDEPFLPRETPPVISDFVEMMTKKQITVKLLVHESARDNVMEYCNAENITPHDAHHFIALLPFIDDDPGYNLLLSFGDRCECLEPAGVRQELIRRIEALARLYQRSRT